MEKTPSGTEFEVGESLENICSEAPWEAESASCWLPGRRRKEGLAGVVRREVWPDTFPG